HHSKDNVTSVVIEQAGARNKKIEKQVRELGATGDELLADGNAREALAIFEQAVALGGTETPWSVFYNRGRAYAATERYGDAVRDFKIAAQSEPDSVKPFWRLGEAYLATGLLGAAETAFHHAATMPVRDGDEKAQEKAKAGLVKVTKVSEQRMEDERKRLEKDQKEIRAEIRKLGGSGNQLLTEGRTQEALATYTQAIARGGGLTPWNIYYNRGRANLADGNPEAAISDLWHAGQLEPRSVKPAWQSGEVYLSIGDLDSAERAFNHAATIPVREGDEDAHRKAREGLARIAELRNVAVPEPSIDPDPVSRAVSWAKRRWKDRRSR
ncbi:MAG: tetratricopeptide repeat protein, partial [Candidatus Levybacteria bacterium]|nr:tetratricopeptide repeat protein [Candidatus Levybacteria bacterium]